MAMFHKEVVVITSFLFLILHPIDGLSNFLVVRQNYSSLTTTNGRLKPSVPFMKNAKLHLNKQCVDSVSLSSSTSSSSNVLSSIDKLRLREDQSQALEKFLSKISQSLVNKCNDDSGDEEFVSFLLRGRKVPRKTKRMSDAERAAVVTQKESMRGEIREINGRLIMLKDGKKKRKNFDKDNHSGSSLHLHISLKYHSATDIVKNYELGDNVDDIKNMLMNLIIPSDTCESIVTVSEWGGNTAARHIQSGKLITAKGIWNLDITNQHSSKKKNKKAIFKFSAFNEDRPGREVTSFPVTTHYHDTPKNLLLDASAPFFQRLGISDANGKPKHKKNSKLKQCQKFVEITSKLIEKSGMTVTNENNYVDSTKPVSDSKVLKIVDLGCGRGYLTFSLHAFLVMRYNDFKIVSKGVEVRPKLVKEINDIARKCGPTFDNLSFVTGTIEDELTAKMPVKKEEESLIILALHACDTATDDAVFYGIKNCADIIIVAPCCQKELRRYVDSVSIDREDHPLANILKYNIYKERLSEIVTDSLRALLLEIWDYDVNVLEFIGGEHTSKNVMITAVKRKRVRKHKEKAYLRDKLKALASFHGIPTQKLSIHLNETLNDGPMPLKSKEVIRTMPKL